MKSGGLHQVPPTLAVNAPLSGAIMAHQKAFRQGDHELAHLLLRSVVMAKTGTVNDARRMLDYLTALPIEAWPSQGGDPAVVRDETLAGIRRSIGWRMVE